MFSFVEGLNSFRKGIGGNRRGGRRKFFGKSQRDHSRDVATNRENATARRHRLIGTFPVFGIANGQSQLSHVSPPSASSVRAAHRHREPPQSTAHQRQGNSR